MTTRQSDIQEIQGGAGTVFDSFEAATNAYMDFNYPDFKANEIKTHFVPPFVQPDNIGPIDNSIGGRNLAKGWSAEYKVLKCLYQFVQEHSQKMFVFLNL